MANIIISDHFGITEEFKRPDHTDFMDSSELKAKEWSGIRHNSISNKLELWVAGTVRGEYLLSEEDRMMKDFAEIFGLHHVEIDKGAN